LRTNNFGAMRLILALFVLISHSFAAYFGTHEHVEPIHRLTGGQLDLSGFAVNAFFAISGYLITLSWLSSQNFKTYMMKRVLRIYPGFIVASLVSLLIVAPLAGAHWNAFTPKQIIAMLGRILLLSDPKVPGAFAEAPMQVLNLSLWTIRYEFICYLLVPLVVTLLSKTGHLRSGITLIYLALLGWHASQGTYLAMTGARQIFLLGSVDVWPRFGAYFAGGMVLAFNADRIPFRHWIALACVALVIVTGWYGKYMFLAVATAGMYLVYYAAYQQTIKLSHVGERVDLSYGVYLYAWPVQNLLVYYFAKSFNVWAVIGLTLPFTLALAALSWHFIEAPFLVKKAKLMRKQLREPQASPANLAPSASPLAYAPPRAASDMASMIIDVRQTQKV
jgi:peptidoglycan/LPS O-acetylase OafA/YrhL